MSEKTPMRDFVEAVMVPTFSKPLPYLCPEHPLGAVLHIDGRCECADCGTELSQP